MMFEEIQEVDSLLAEMQSVDSKIVLDGAVDAERYINSSPRILWILREPNGSGPWDLREYFREKLFTNNRWRATAAVPILVSYGLLNGAIPWDALPVDPKNIADSLRETAIININKRGGGSRVKWKHLRQARFDFGDIICNQIEALKPQIVVLAGTLGVLPITTRAKLADLNGASGQSMRVGETVFISMYHPNQRTIPRKEYYQRVCDACENAS